MKTTKKFSAAQGFAEIAKIGGKVIENLSDENVTDITFEGPDGRMFELYADQDEYYQKYDTYSLIPIN